MNVRSLKSGVAAIAAGMLAAGTLPAQQISPSCAGQGLAQDACQKAADIFAFMAPQLAVSIAGGNATLGQGSVLGGLGHFSIGVRATALQGELPDLESVEVESGPAQRSTFAVEDQIVGLPQVDVGVGVFKGFPVGLTNIGGIDLLASASWIPELEEDDFTLRATDGQFQVGYGARLGILQETLTMPGVSITYLRRQLPSADIIARPDNDTLSVLDAGVTVDSWRAVVSKKVLVFGFAAGVGQDRSETEANVSAVVNDGIVRIAMGTPQPFSQTLTRTNAFANLTLHMAVLKLTGEVGRVWGGDAPTFNSFEGTSAAEPRLYGSVGLRLGF